MSLIVLAGSGIAIATTSVFALRWWSNYQKYSSLRNFPSPKGHWLSGNFSDLVAALKAGKLPQLFIDWSKELGDVFVIWNFDKPNLVIGNAKLIKQILLKGQKDGDFVRGGSAYSAYADVFGVHLGNQIGEEWQWRRKAWTPALASSKFLNQFDVINQASLAFIEKLEQKAINNEAIEIDPLFLKYTMSIIAYFMLGVPLIPQEDPIKPILDSEKIYSSLAVLEKQVLVQGTTGFNWLKYLPTKKNQVYREAQNYLNGFLHPRIDLAFKLARNQELNQNELSQISQPLRNSIMVQMAKAPRYTPNHLINDVRAGLFAGHDTTSHSLSFAMGELALNPQVLQKAREKIEPVMKQGLSIESLKKLVYIEAIFKETMRLHPVASQLSIVAKHDTSMVEKFIPADTAIRLNLMLAGLDSDMYAQPEAFHPERWLDVEENGGIEPTLFGFSLGAHYCLGAPLAILEATVILSLLIYHFDWELVNGRSSLEQLGQNITVFPQDRMPIKFKARKFANMTT
ncbi:cytochrome P450 [Rivularia sp. PCC 7116]|uniref:cytochrome P450 n=1 Tax=Rivularia sp. PCC 7116 TaxID=373994 RepID=UPI00029F28B8|nr:cytochrome P450 [Rivularia sp. PCC 7116]AFY54046.1 cytochrome P450 [Rivularia sp. PCC 7116]